MTKILVTGGAGYIGSHTCVELLTRGYDLVILDNFSNSSRSIIKRIEQLGGRKVQVIEASIEKDDLDVALQGLDIGSVIHFAALKSVAESFEKPIRYHEVNVFGTLRLIRWANSAGVSRFVFSSSATVYGIAACCPVDERAPLNPINPYGQTKLYCEELLHLNRNENPKMRHAILRYFNPAGAHCSGLIGEAPVGIPANLFPYLGGVIMRRFEGLRIFGTDYPTRDGTGVRDYVHVMDLAEAHCVALEKLLSIENVCVNIGTGRGYSVREVVRAFETAAGLSIPLLELDRRAGDAAECYADTALCEHVLGWKASRGLEKMCEDSLRWLSGQRVAPTLREADS